MKNRQMAAGKTAMAETRDPELEAAFSDHWGQVYRVLYRLVGDPAEAEDLALETFVRLHRTHPAWATDFNLGGWLHRVATNLGLQSLRSRRRREHYEISAGKASLDQAPDETPAQIVERQEMHHLARRALAKMNRRQAELLTLRYSGLAYREIAAALGLSPASIGTLLLRAEREFERQYRALSKEDR